MDDEITFDLDKVKNFFKRKPKKESQEEPNSEVSEDEISIDFSKIKNIFKRSGKSGDEATFNLDSLKSVVSFAKKYQVVFLIIIPIILSVFLRMQTAYLPITDDWATQSVYTYYRNTIRTQVNQNYPTLPDAKKNELVEQGLLELLNTQGDVINQQIAVTSSEFRSKLQDENGQTYLLAIDPYYWLRFVENIEKNGHMGDKLVDGKPFDDHFLAPLGRFVGGDDFHIKFEYFVYRILKIFNRDMYPLKAAFYVPIILAALSVVPIFFITRKIGGNIGGLFAALMVAIHPTFLTRTAGGFADTDAYNVLFPLLITWLFFEAFDVKNKKLRISLSAVAGLLVGVYSITWGGWWYIFDFLLFVAGIYFIYNVIIHWNSLKLKRTKKVIYDILLIISVFVLSASVFTIALTNSANLKKTYTSPLWFMTIKEVGKFNIWPNVYTTVAEQNEIPIQGIIGNIGGKNLFYISLIGIALSLLKRDKNGKLDVKYAVLLAVWFFSTMYASTKGVRWILLLVPAFSIAFGTFVGVIVRYVSNYVSKELKINKFVAVVLLVSIFATLLNAPFNGALQTARNEIPSMNDAWVASLTKIKTNSSEDAIINSWWDFGHWFKYWADRAVTFDGTSQTGPRAHWIGKVLLTGNEEQAIGILRMLDCGGHNAFLELEEENNDSLESIRILNELFVLDKDEAKQVLIEHVGESKAETVLELTHCEPPEDFFIASEDMVSKSGVWAHFGSWNFDRAAMVFYVKPVNDIEGVRILQEDFGLSAELASQYQYQIKTRDANSWIAPWPSYLSQPVGCSMNQDVLKCGNGINLNLTSGEAYIESPQGKLHPRSVTYIDDNGKFTEVTYDEPIWRDNNNREVSATIYPQGNGHGSILLAPELASSMFTRMFFFGGQGLKYFEPFSHYTTFNGLDIYTYKVDWEGTQQQSI